MTVQELTNKQIEQALDRYDDLYSHALEIFDGGLMDLILKLWDEVEAEAISRGLIEKVDA
jgi:hypothetical protein